MTTRFLKMSTNTKSKKGRKKRMKRRSGIESLRHGELFGQSERWPYRFVQWRLAPIFPQSLIYNTSVCFVLLRWDMVSSEKPKWALTSSGGVNASHWVSEISSKRSSKQHDKPSESEFVFFIPDLFKSHTSFQDLKELQSRISGIFYVVTWTKRKGDNEILFYFLGDWMFWTNQMRPVYRQCHRAKNFGFVRNISHRQNDKIERT